MIGKLPRIDILVANSGGPAPGMAPGIASDVWAKEFDAMVLGLIEIIDAAVDRMKEANFGQVIVIGSSGIVADSQARSLKYLKICLGWIHKDPV